MTSTVAGGPFSLWSRSVEMFTGQGTAAFWECDKDQYAWCFSQLPGPAALPSPWSPFPHTPPAASR